MTVEPFELFVPPFGSWSTTIPFASSESTSTRAGTKPARWSSEAACSYGRPIDVGDGHRLRPARHVDAHLTYPRRRPSRALGSGPVTVPGSFSESTSTTCASSPAVVSSATASVVRLPDDARNRHLGLPGRDVDRHDRVLLDLRPLGRALGEDEALLDVGVGDVANAWSEPAVEDLVDGERPFDAHDVGHCDGLCLLQLALDDLEEQESAGDGREHGAQTEKPRPDRALLRARLVGRLRGAPATAGDVRHAGRAVGGPRSRTG